MNIFQVHKHINSLNAFSECESSYNQGCFRDPKGTISSVNYPSDYPSNSEDYWLIAAPEGLTVTVAFQDFKTEEDFSCDNYDYLVLYDGTQISDPELARACGTTPPECTTSSFNDLLIAFSSDSFTEYRGFSLSYNFIGTYLY